MVGEKVTVYLNGELVVDNVVMENYWTVRNPSTPPARSSCRIMATSSIFATSTSARFCPPRRGWRASCRCSTAGHDRLDGNTSGYYAQDGKDHLRPEKAGGNL